MFLEFINNLAVKFRNITCETPETSLKKARINPEKLRENKKSAASMQIELGSHGTADEHDNHYTIRGLETSRQKDNINVTL